MTTALAGGAAQAVIRTMASVTGAPYTQSAGTLYYPKAPLLNKAWIREEINMQYINGTPFGVGVKARWQVSRDVDVTPWVNLRFTAARIPAANWNGGATFTRYVDMLGLGAWSKCVLQSGTQVLQTIFPEEMMMYILKFLDITARGNALAIIGAGTPAERDTRTLRDFEINVPMFTNLGFRLHGDPSQALYTRGLNDLLTWAFDFRPANEIIETDGTLPTAGANGFLFNGALVQEGVHIQQDERTMLLQFYDSTPFSIHFDDQQYASQIIIPFNQAIPGVFTTQVLNITQPVVALFITFRWQDDMTRVAGGANGTRGRDAWNFGGAYNAGGGAQDSILSTVRLTSGNTDVFKEMPLQRLNTFQHYVDFQGPANTSVANISYSHNAAIPNSCLGFVSFEQIERPQIRVSFVTPQTGVAFASVGAAAAADIGVGAGTVGANLLMDIIGFTKNEVAVAKYLLARAFN